MRNGASKRKTLSILLLAAATPLCMAAPARSQTQSNPDANRPAQAQQNDRQVRDSDVTRPELAEFDRFLDGHPEISEQLKRDPALLNDGKFVDQHPALDKYLDSHPDARSEMRENPYAFMHMENRFDRDEAGRLRAADVDRDRFTRFREFCDNHREIAEQLRKNPALVNDRDFVSHHDALETYWREHPEDRDAMRQNPNGFMRDSDRFNRGELGGGAGAGRDMDRERMASFHEFLGSHSDVARDVDRRHDLVKDHDYVEHHRELNAYLNAHPDVRDQWSKDPDNFVKGSREYTGANAAAKTTTTANPSGVSTGSGASAGAGTSGSPGSSAGSTGNNAGSTGNSSNPGAPAHDPHNR